MSTPTASVKTGAAHVSIAIAVGMITTLLLAYIVMRLQSVDSRLEKLHRVVRHSMAPAACSERKTSVKQSDVVDALAQAMQSVPMSEAEPIDAGVEEVDQHLKSAVLDLGVLSPSDVQSLRDSQLRHVLLQETGDDQDSRPSADT